MTESQADNQKKWLVKSSSRILGPFSIKEIAEMLQKKHLSLIDEVRDPSVRWMFIRENTQFLHIVEKIREAQTKEHEHTVSGSSTKTLSGVTQKTVTKTMTASNTAKLSSDVTATPIDVQAVHVADPITVTNIQPPLAAGALVPLEGNLIAERTYDKQSEINSGFENLNKNSKTPSLRASQTGIWLKWGILTLALCMLGYILFGVYRTKKNVLNYKELQSQALYYKGIGLYDEALQYYHQAVQAGTVDDETKFQMALPLISIERQTNTGRSILEAELTSQNTSRARQIEAYLGIGISHLLESNLKNAEESFTHVLGLDPGNPWAKTNLSVVYQLMGQLEQAEKLSIDAIKKNAFEPVYFVVQGLTLIEMSRGTPQIQKLQDYLGTTEKLLESIHNYRLEIRLIRSFMFSLLNEKEKYESSVRDLLSELAFEGNRFYPEIHLDSRLVSWDNLERYCSELLFKEEQKSEAKAMRSICLQQVGRDMEARKLMDEAVLAEPKNPYVLFSSAQLTAKMGLLHEASVIFKIHQLGQIKNAEILRLNVCIEMKDWMCAQTYFENHPNLKTPQEYYYQAIYKRQTQGTKDLLPIIQAGLTKDSRYIPLIELSNRINQTEGGL